MTDILTDPIPTKNKMGFSTQVLDQEYSQKFIDYIKKLSSPHVLEIGPGYGTATCLALSVGAFVTAHDLEAQHLDILKKRVSPDLLPRLTLKAGKFPQDSGFYENHFEAILMSQVLHFLTSQEIEQGVSLLLKWLKPGGKIFLTAISPYIGVLKKFLLLYQERKQQGVSWPGEIEDLREYCNHPCCEINPNFIHVFDPDVLRFHFSRLGFKVEKTDYYPIWNGKEPEFKNDGRECVGIIALKP